MKYIKNILIVICLMISFSSGQKIYIHAGKLIDGVTDIPIEMVTIVINGNIIQSVLRLTLDSIQCYLA